MRIPAPLAILLVGLASASARAQPCPSDELPFRTIVVDPGHGGSNQGALGVLGIYERFLTMDTAKRLQTRLRECYPDIDVRLTRQHDVDVSLGERTHIANMAAADLFLSIHYNAADNPDAQGVEVFYLATDPEVPQPWAEDTRLIAPSGAVVASILNDLEETQHHRSSARLARYLLTALVEQTGAHDRGVRQDRFRVLRGALMPAVVVELGFLTHEVEGRRLIDPTYVDRLVEGLVVGIAHYAASSPE